jgi:hypothetical protein
MHKAVQANCQGLHGQAWILRSQVLHINYIDLDEIKTKIRAIRKVVSCLDCRPKKFKNGKIHRKVFQIINNKKTVFLFIGV